MTQSILHKAATRGGANHGWLKSNFTFSFAEYYNPERIHFGALRVLNDDTIAEGKGFGTHPHDNMEIITIPLEGAVAHKDSMGTEEVVHAGEIQVMSAGTGVSHSEYNPSETGPLKLLQIWIFPNKKNVIPRYGQMKLDEKAMHNQFSQILSPNADDAGVWINQDAWFSMGKFDKDVAQTYNIKKAGNGIYAFVIDGSVTINDQELDVRDGFGIWDTDHIEFKSNSAGAKVLLMDLPMYVD